MIDVRDLTVTRGEQTTLSDVSLTVESGEWVGLIGANGAGKSTLLRAIVQLERYEGSVLVAGDDLSSLPARRRAQLVAFQPQSPSVPADMTVGEYVLLGRTPHISYFSLESRTDEEICRGLIETLGLTSLGPRRLSTLSGGELQRVFLARSLAQEAPVLLLDEPTSALDLGRRIEAMALVDDVRREKQLTVLSAMHDLTIAAEFADRLVLLSGGRAVASGRVDEVLDEETLSLHFGGPVRVLTTEDGDLVVVPRSRRRRLALSREAR